jgi:hypothetical protein
MLIVDGAEICARLDIWGVSTFLAPCGVRTAGQYYVSKHA